MSAEQIATDVWRLQGNPGHCNVYFLRSGDGVVMYDAGAKSMREEVAAAAEELGGLESIVLGHAHTDHRGTAPLLGVPVRCHPDAVAEAQGLGGWEYWDPKLRFMPLPLRIAHRYLHRAKWDGGPVQIASTVEVGEEIAAGFRVVLLDGHAPGQIALWREQDRIALTSDVFYNVDMWGRHGPAALPVEGYSQDPARARQSVLRLAELEPEACYPGHSSEITANAEEGTVAAQLRRAAG